MSFLSEKNIPANERLIVALDLPTVEQARHLAERLGDAVRFYKIGLSLIFDPRYWELVEWLQHF